MKVTVVGTGYVGLVSGVCLSELGHDIVCVDASPERVDAVTGGVPPFHEPGLTEKLQVALRSGCFRATTDLADALRESDVSIIAVGTPSHDGRIDLGQIRAAAAEIGSHLRSIGRYHVVTVKSTVEPTTTDSVVHEILARESRMKPGEFGLCMNPEFLREGTAVSDFTDPDRIVIGQLDERSGDAIARLYEAFRCPVVRTSLRNAELIKYVSNSLLANLVSFSNEIAALCEALPGANEEVVMRGLHLDRRLRSDSDGEVRHPEIVSFLRGGIGFGGSCLPKDVVALRHFARSRGVPTTLLDAVLEVNARRPGQIVTRLEETLGGLSGRLTGVLGLAFKPHTDDLRESPAVGLIEALLERGARVRAFDPVAGPAARRKFGGQIEIVDSAEDAVVGASSAVIGTSWPEFRQYDWNALTRSMKSPVVVDGRQVIDFDPRKHEFTYIGIGIGAH